MSLWTKLESQLVNLREFRPFFPALRTLGDVLVLPAQMARKGGKSNKFPHVININITTRCNLRCPYCFNADNKVARSDELTFDEYQKLVDRWAPYRPGIFLSGGEPFARGDLLELVDLFKRRGMPVGIVTNGTLLDEEKAKRLGKLKLDAMLVSFHGQREVHDKAVGLPGAYDKSLETLRLWAKYAPSGPGPMVNYILTPESIEDLPGFVDEVADINPLSLRLSHLNFLTADEMQNQMDFWRERFGDVPIEILSHQWEPREGAFAPLIEFLQSDKAKGIFTKPVLDDGEINSWYSRNVELGRRCVFIWRSTFLNAQGDVYPCQFLYVRMGNLREQTMAQIWNNDLYRKFREVLNEGLMPGCARCCKI